jgi:hypothetical protein
VLHVVVLARVVEEDTVGGGVTGGGGGIFGVVDGVAVRGGGVGGGVIAGALLLRSGKEQRGRRKGSVSTVSSALLAVCNTPSTAVASTVLASSLHPLPPLPFSRPEGPPFPVFFNERKSEKEQQLTF